jgi:tRNA/tmRNA/rRNA uracil-C5-methylase (TrmA/RlmC/RlmD family)
VSAQVLARAGAADLVVLDPPRSGAGLEVTRALAALRPRRLAYVACDPASFARDLRVLLDAGWSLRELRGLDLFPMTEHVELVAVLEPPVTS